MAQDLNGSNVTPAKNIVKVNVLRANVKQTKVIDTDIVFVLEDGRTVFIRDGAVQSLLDNGFSVEFSDGAQATGQELLQSAGAAEISSVALSGPQASSNDGVIVAQAPQAAGTSPVAQPSSGGGLRTWLAVGTPLVGGVLGGVLGGGSTATATTDPGTTANVKPATPVINVIANDDKVNATEKAGGVSVTGTSEASASVTVNWGSTTKTVTADSTGRWSASFASTEVPADATGTTISATVKSTAGVSSDPATKTVLIDTTPPAAPVIANVAGDNIVGPSEKASGVNINGTAEAGSTITVGFGGINKTVAADMGGNWSVNYTATEVPVAGNYAVTATARDANGNVGTAPASLSIIVAAAVNLTGQIVAGPVVVGNGLSVDIYLANGTLLVSGIRVSADGSFTATNLPVGAGDVIYARVVDSTTAADYLDEATGVPTDLNAVLLAVKAVEGTSVTMNINPLTTIAAIKAGLAADGSGTIANAAAATNANTATAQAFGLSGIDITTASVVATNSGGYTSVDGLSSGEKVGAVLAALSGLDSLNAGNSQTTISALSQLVNVDGNKGQLSSQGQLSLMRGAAAAEDRVEGSLQNLISDSVAASSPVTQVTISSIATDNIITANEVANLTLSGTVSSGVTGVSVLLGTRTAAASVTGTTWSYALSAADVAALGADGAKIIQAQAALPNAASATASRLVTLKIAPPVTPSLDIISGDNAINAKEKGEGVGFSGTGEVGSTIVLTFGNVTKTALVDTNGAWSTAFLSSEIPADGTSTVSLSARDTFGNSSGAVTRPIRIDTIAPTLPTVGSVTGDDLIGPTEKLGGVAIRGTADGLATVRLTFGNLVRTTTAESNGNWTVNLLSSQIPEDGEYSLNVTQFDAVGNVSAEASRTVKVDAQPPAKPVILPVATDNIINAAEKLNGVTLRGTAEPNVSIELTWGAISRIIKAGANGTWSASFTGAQIPADGLVNVTAIATDSSGNISEVAFRAVTIDTLSQNLTIDSVATDNVINAAERAVNVEVTGKAEAGAKVNVTLGGLTQSELANQAGIWVVNFKSSEIPPDTDLTTVTAQSTDQAGNVSGLVGRDIRIDSLLPDPPVINKVSTDDAINVDEITSPVQVSGTAEIGSLVTVTWGTATRTATADAEGVWNTTFAPSQLPPEGASVITATARDRALNFSAATERPVLIDIGTARPVINTIAGNDVINATERNNGVIISGTAEAGAKVRLVWGTVVKEPVALADGTWSQLFLESEIPLSGNSSITATPTDTFGNPGAAQTRNFSIDTQVAPADFNNVAGLDDTVNVSEKSLGVQVTGVAEAGSTVVLTWGTATRSVTADASGVWATFYTRVQMPADGAGKITAVVTDLAGNVSVTSEHPVLIDSTPPLAPVVTLPIAGDDVINSSERAAGVVVAGTAEANADVTIAWDTISTQTVKADGAGAWTATFTSGQINIVGAATIRVTQRDVAGNSGPEATATIIVNTGAPAAPTLDPVAVNDIVGAVEKSAGIVITGTAISRSMVSVDWGITKTIQANIDGIWVVTFDAAEVPSDGARTISVIQTDLLGNISPPTTRAIIVDTAPPQVPVITVPIAIDNFINASEKNSAVTISGTAPISTELEVRIGGVVKTATSSNTGLWSVTFGSTTIPADATGVLVEARTIDTAGNPSIWVGEPFNIDTAAPATPLIFTVAGDNIINATERAGSIFVSGTAEANASVLVTWNNVVRNVTASNLGAWTVSYASSEQPSDGTSIITARATDVAGNANAVDGTRSVTTLTAGALPPVINQVAGDDRINIAERAAGITVTGTASANAQVAVTFGTTTKTVLANGEGLWTTNFTSSEIAAEGSPRPITAVQTDVNGNVSNPATRNVEVDLTAPVSFVINQTGGPDGIVNAAEKALGVAVSGTATDAANIEVIWGSVTKTVAVTNGSWLAVFGASEVPADAPTSTIRVTAIDTAGNRSAERPSNVTIDTAAPATPVISTVAGDNLINATERAGNIIVSGTAEANARLVITWNGINKTATASGSGEWSVTYTSAEQPSDGTSIITARATDVAGNANAVDGTRSVTTLTAGALPPVINQVAGDDRINIAERAAGITVTGTASANAQVAVTFGTTTKNVLASGAGLWTANFASADPIAAEGLSRPITAVQTDANGNVSNPATRNVVVDLTAPVNLVINQTGGVDPTPTVNAAEKAASVLVSGTTDAGNQIVVTWGGIEKSVTSINGTWTVSYAAGEVPADSPASTISVRAQDEAGNFGSQVTQIVTIDTTVLVPVINVVSSNDRVNATEAGQSIEIRGTAEANGKVTLRWGATTARVLDVDANGNWSTIYLSNALPAEGTSAVTATQTDVAGNVSIQASRSVEIDTVAPAAAVITGMSNDYGFRGDFTTDRNAVVLTGTGDANTQIELFVDSQTRGLVTVDSAGLWVSPLISLAALAPGGTVTARVQTIDLAGNINATNVSQVITKEAASGSALIDVGTLTSAIGFTIGGADNDDRINSFATGDMNGDGRKDLILNSFYMDYINTSNGNRTEKVGGVTVVYGKATWANTGNGNTGSNLANLGNDGWVLRGVSTSDELGQGTSGFIGDLNADGRGELIAGAPFAENGTTVNAGAAYIVYGSQGAPVGSTLIGGRYFLDTSQITQAVGFVFRGLTENELLGTATLGISNNPGGDKDFNGDGIADFFITAQRFDRPAAAAVGTTAPAQTAANDVGATIVVFGRNDGAYGTVDGSGQRVMTIDNLNATNGFIIRGEEPGDSAGFSLASAGDVNGDGVTDLLIGAFLANRGGPSNTGAAYVIYGKANGTWGSLTDDPTMAGRRILDLSRLQQEDGFKILGDQANDELGRAVAGAGDVNGDGFDDIVLGAPNVSVGGIANVGAAYVVFGSATGQGNVTNFVQGDVTNLRQTLDVRTMTSSQGFIIRGVPEGVGTLVAFGSTVGAAGDVNADGLSDIIIAAPRVNKGVLVDVGRAYIIYGKSYKIEGNTTEGEGWGQTVDGQSILDAGNLGQADGFTIVGRTSNNEQLGGLGGAGGVVSPGDLNNDGVDDLFMNILNADTLGRANNGEALFVYGIRGQGGLTINETNGATNGGNVLNGGGLADVINGLGGADRLRGFDGNDILIIGDNSFVRVDGGTGTDTLRLAGPTGFGLNLSTLAAGAIRDIEQIDLVVGSLNNSLTVTQQSLLDLSSTSDLLKVFGDVNDTVTATGFATSGSIIENGINFAVYTSGAATLWVQSGVNVVGATPQSAGFVLTGLNGNETLIVGNTNFARVDGGAGTDTLRLAGTTGLSLDLSSLAAGAVQGIEQIDLVAGSLNNTLSITQQTLLDLSSTSNRLTVLGDLNDTVNAAGFTAGAQNQNVNGILYDTYTNGLAELWVQDGVVVNTPAQLGFVAPAISWADHAVLAA